METRNDYSQDSVYYSRIVMMIIFAVQLILLIVFIVTIHGVDSIMTDIYHDIGQCKKIFDCTYNEYTEDYDCGYKMYCSSKDVPDFRSIFNEQKQGIDTCFAFFIISFVAFLLEFILHFACENHNYSVSIFNTIFNELNHFMIILTFTIAQFLYVIGCLLIPIYLDRIRTLKDFLDINKKYKSSKGEDNEELFDICIGRYVGLLIIGFVFLFLFIFLYFIIINLYKGVCCEMTIICDRTHKCLGSFFGCFADNVYFIFNKCERKDKEINDIVKNIKEKEKEMAGVTCSIQDLMKDNIEIRIKNMEYL